MYLSFVGFLMPGFGHRARIRRDVYSVAWSRWSLLQATASISYGNCCFWLLRRRHYSPYNAQPPVLWFCWVSRGCACQRWIHPRPHGYCYFACTTPSPSQERGHDHVSVVDFLPGSALYVRNIGVITVYKFDDSGSRKYPRAFLLLCGFLFPFFFLQLDAISRGVDSNLAFSTVLPSLSPRSLLVDLFPYVVSDFEWRKHSGPSTWRYPGDIYWRIQYNDRKLNDRLYTHLLLACSSECCRIYFLLRSVWLVLWCM